MIDAGRRAGRATDHPRRHPRRGSPAPRSSTPAGRASPTGRDEEIAEAVGGGARLPTSRSWSLGERSGLTDDSTTGEFRDRRDLGFLGRQQELLDAVVATGTPVVLVVVSGRPLAIEWAAGHCAAILLAWVPGDAGPDAIADVLTGVANPGGKLPVSMPRARRPGAAHVPPPSDGRALEPEGRLRRRPDAPLWPFGFGLLVHDVHDRPAAPRPRRAGHRRRRASRSASTSRTPATVPATRSSSSTSATRRRPSPGPSASCAASAASALAPGECRTVTFRLSPSSSPTPAPTTGASSSPGRIGIALGTSSVDLPLSASVTLVGPTIDLRERQHYLSEVVLG